MFFLERSDICFCEVFAAALKGPDFKSSCGVLDNGSASLLGIMDPARQAQVQDVQVGAAMFGQAIIAAHAGFSTPSPLIECLNSTADVRTKLSSLFCDDGENGDDATSRRITARASRRG